MKKLYVGGLPFEYTTENLKELFGDYTTLSATVITDKFTGRSKGFGFVEFEDDSQATEAIEKYNGSQVGGRSITVNEARPKTDAGPRRSGGGGRPSFGGGGDRNRRSGGGRPGGNRW
ncbi:MAG: RNA-binding protein [Elusimicrobiaceae bacterium]|jgi:RNA recognition motif-containing protein